MKVKEKKNVIINEKERLSIALFLFLIFFFIVTCEKERFISTKSVFIIQNEINSRNLYVHE